MITVLILGLLSIADPALGKSAVKPAATTTSSAKTPVKKAVVSKAEASPGVAMDPEVKKVVDAMQAFYEKTADFTAHFEQTYSYASFHRVQKSAGQVIFKKPALMRWDYTAPSPKTIVVAGGLVYMYDAEAQQMTKASLDLEKLSASVTFLWGRGKLADEFFITRAKRKDLGGGLGLELTPKKVDPRFAKVFFGVDAKTHAVEQTIVVDPDGSENHMIFSQEKIDQGVGAEAFHFEPPAGTQMIDMTQGAAKKP